MNENQIKSIKELNLDDFIKFVDKDKRGKITYIGKVIKLDDGYVTMECFQGIMGFKIDPENELYKDEKPVGWDKFQKDPHKFRNELMQKEKMRDTAPEVKTQKELVFDIVKENKTMSKLKLLKLIKEKLNVSDEDTLKTQMELALIKLS